MCGQKLIQSFTAIFRRDCKGYWERIHVQDNIPRVVQGLRRMRCDGGLSSRPEDGGLRNATAQPPDQPTGDHKEN
jgi:hypothetical protein